MVNSAAPLPEARRFPALSVPHFRLYAMTSGLAMTADNIEHVIGYWLIWELTRSPFWLGYAVVAHWLPFTLFSLHSGSLADRFNYRRLMLVAQGTYFLVNFGWGFLYLSGQLRIWHVAILLVFHGMAGLVFAPGSMLIIHEMVGRERLVSAISLNASLRPIAITLGPAVGGLLMWAWGPGWGFFVNILFHLPLTLALLFLPYGRTSAVKQDKKGWPFIMEGLTTVRQSPTIVAVLFVMAVTSFLVGNPFQAIIPAFAGQLGVSSTGYSILLSSHGTGAVLGGLLLGWIGVARLRPVVVTAAALAWSVVLILFAISHVFLLSLVLLCMAGIAQMLFISMSQSIVQAWAPNNLRGRVVGVYNLAAHGIRVLSGFFLGTLATLIGAPQMLLLLAAIIGALILGTSTVVRSLWQAEMKEEFARPEGAGASVAGA